MMTTYIVAFDVNDINRMKILENKLGEYDGYCPIHDNCWAVVSSKSPTEIRNSLIEVLSESDSVFVVRSGTSAAWYNSYSEKHDKWLKEKL